MPQRHMTLTRKIYLLHMRERFSNQVFSETARLFINLNRPPTLREISVAVGRAPSGVLIALTELEKRGLVTRRDVGNRRVLESCAGVPSEAERIVRRLADAGLLAGTVDQALSAVAGE